MPESEALPVPDCSLSQINVPASGIPLRAVLGGESWPMDQGAVEGPGTDLRFLSSFPQRPLPTAPPPAGQRPLLHRASSLGTPRAMYTEEASWHNTHSLPCHHKACPLRPCTHWLSLTGLGWFKPSTQIMILGPKTPSWSRNCNNSAFITGEAKLWDTANHLPKVTGTWQVSSGQIQTGPEAQLPYQLPHGLQGRHSNNSCPWCPI